VNFFEHQDRARRQSRWLILVFIAAVIAIVAAVNGVVLLTLTFTAWEPQAGTPGIGQMFRTNLPLIAGVSLASVAVIGIASLFKTASLRSGGGQVARQLGGTLVESDTRDPDRRRLRNVVEEIALASGVPVPEIYVLDRESGINAFAAGYSPSDAAVAVTRGALEKLSRSELQGVIAHEFSHILNGDMRINIRLMGTLFGILMLALIGRRVLIHSHFAGRSSRDRNGAVLLAIAFGLFAIGYIGLFFGRWIKAAVSRQREYLADASAVQFTRDPDSIGGALKKIAVYSDASYLDADTEEVSHMLFGDGRKMLLFSTHPPLDDRIRRVDPGFQPEELARLAAEIQRDQLRAQKKARAGQESGAKKNGKFFDAGDLVDGIGKPEWERILMAAALAASVPESLQKAVNSMSWTPEVLFYALIDRNRDVRERQLLDVANRMGSECETRVRTLLDAAGPAKAEQRLPLLEMAFPLLKQRPPHELTRVLDTVKAIAAADGKTDVFEYLLARQISGYLWESQNPHRVEISGNVGIGAVQPDAMILLSVLAQHGHDQPDAVEGAYRAGLAALALASYEARPDDQQWVSRLDSALDRLDRLKAADKEKLVRAMTAVVTHDGQLKPEELELLRAACATIHVPLPLLSTERQTSPQS
jgi:Zn-dependent protease with chaperone function/tellurite resistance protein